MLVNYMSNRILCNPCLAGSNKILTAFLEKQNDRCHYVKGKGQSQGQTIQEIGWQSQVCLHTMHQSAR